VLVFPV